MVRDKNYFEELHRLPREITIAVAKSGQSLIAKYAGTTRTCAEVEGRKLTSVVEEVLYVPGLHLNLFSISRLEDKGMTITFADGKVKIAKNNQIVATGRKCGRLYQLNFTLHNQIEALLTKEVELDVWHRRYGHLGEANLRKLWKNRMVTTKSTLSEAVKRNPCEVCLNGKQTRQPFGSTDNQRSSRVLELVHSDVSGPFTPGTYDCKKYFVTFIDDFSHFTVVYLLRSKDEVLECFEQYSAKVTAHFGLKIARIRCDNGGEYTSKAFRMLCRKEGITLEYTAPCTLEQNGVAERMNRTLLDKARSMVFDAGFPKTLWGEAVLTAAYLANRSPTSALEVSKTPYEVWYNKKNLI